ncbi:beta strand repeat-containing protein [uncultured Jatrophihabitans sp.]|uniref:beta strand repeat-containing protein n=1 Tax=uncultured Jatrophihabitans sp. TaxID=1610747 RepID=UPI0035CA65AE
MRALVSGVTTGCAFAFALTLAATPAFAASGDVTPPSVSSFTIVPGTVDDGYQDASATVVTRIVDTGGSPTATQSGFASGTLTFVNGTTTLGPVSFSGDQRVAGTAVDGTYDLTVPVPQGTPAGTYTPTVTLTDVANKSATTTASASLTVVATTDSQPPVMSGTVSLTPSSLDTTSAGQDTHLAVRLTDALSGVTDATVVLTNPAGGTTPVPLDRTSGSAQDGMWAADEPFTPHDPAGTWTISALTAHDAVGNALNQTTGLGAAVTVHNTTDSAAPRITAVTPPSAVVDTSSGDVSVVVPVHATDDLSGVTDGSLTFTSPDGTQTAFGSFGSAPDFGTAQDGVWNVSVDVPARSESGTWTLAYADVRDAQDNDRGYDISDVPPPSAELHVSSAPDAAAPTLTSVDVGPSQVSTSANPDGSASVVGHVRFADDVSGVAEADVVFAGPDGTPDTDETAVVRTDDVGALVDGTAKNGTVAFAASLSAPASGGWHVASVTLTDRAGNAQTFTPTVTAHTSFTVTAAGADTSKPTISALQLTPASVDASQGAPQVTATLDVDDSGSTASGVAFADVTLESPSGDDVLFAFTGPPASGDTVHGTFLDHESLGRFAEAGTWRVVSASVTDAAGNETDYDATSLPSALQRTVVVAAAADTTAPSATSVAARASSVDVSAGAPVTFDVAAGDDHGGAGVLSASLSLTDQSGRTITGTGSIGTPSPTATVPVDVQLPATNTTGTWTVTTLSVTDGAHNTQTYTGAALTGLGGTHVVSVTGRTDTTPPGATSFTLTPGTLNTSAGAVDAAALVHLTDASGVASASVGVTGPRGQQALRGALQLIAGTAADGWWQAKLTFPRYLDSGTWSAALSVADAAGNTATVDAAHLGAGGTLSITSTADNTPPAVTALSVSPSALTADAADPRVSVSATATDSESGVASVSATFTSPGGRTLTPSLTSKNAGTAGALTFTGSALLPPGADPGQWTLNSLTVVDAAGNSTTYNATQRAALSSGFAVTTAGTPGAPTNVTARPTSATRMLVDWTPPADTGGAAITGYTVSGAPGGACTTTATACVVDNLTPGTAYTFTVTAANRIGAGPASATGAAATTPTGPPSAPGAVTAVRSGVNTALVSWTAPTSSGGSAISGYVVTPLVKGVPATATDVGTATNATVSNLQRGVDYTFQVAARNVAGLGTAARTTEPLVLPATVASAPRAVSVSAGDGTATVRWSAPLDDGGAGALEYTASDGAGHSCSAAGTSCTVTGLVNGIAYAFRIVATNQVGPGAPAISASAIPRSVTAVSAPRVTGTVRYGSADQVTATLTSHGRAAPGQLVSLQYRPITSTGAWSTLSARARTASTGAVSFTSFRPPYSVQVRLVFAAAGPYAVATSGTARISVQRAVSLASATRVRAGHVLHVRVSASPNPTGRIAYLQRRSGSGWVTVTHHTMGAGAYTFSVTSRHRGTATYRVVVSGDSRYATSFSPSRSARVI